jgi:hypothetical protein
MSGQNTRHREPESVQLRPWYKEPWPWVAIAIPAAAVIMGGITLYLALTNPDYIVVDEQQYREISSELRAQDEPGPGQAEQGDGRDDGDGDR